MDKLITTLASIPGVILSFFNYIVSAIASVLDALKTLYQMLCDLKDKIDVMSTSAANGQLNGLPINEAVGTIRYIFGDVAFYFIYLVILFGCLFTIYKLVSLLLQALHSLFDSIGTAFSTSSLGALLSKIF